ncbi:MAG: hypothetical protein ACOZBH_00830 [Patescibacteria group bacterium]
MTADNDQLIQELRILSAQMMDNPKDLTLREKYSTLMKRVAFAHADAHLAYVKKEPFHLEHSLEFGVLPVSRRWATRALGMYFKMDGANSLKIRPSSEAVSQAIPMGKDVIVNEVYYLRLCQTQAEGHIWIKSQLPQSSRT